MEGLLENYLSHKRAEKAWSLMPPTHRILDIGCGHGYFLKHTNAQEKIGIDKEADIYNLSYPDGYFDTITMLAVIEHLEHPQKAIDEVYRLLKRGGCLIITTPLAWTRDLLGIMAELKLISKSLLLEHKFHYTPKKIKRLLNRFDVRMGYFEFGMNLWVRGTRNELIRAYNKGV